MNKNLISTHNDLKKENNSQDNSNKYSIINLINNRFKRNYESTIDKNILDHNDSIINEEKLNCKLESNDNKITEKNDFKLEFRKKIDEN